MPSAAHSPTATVRIALPCRSRPTSTAAGPGRGPEPQSSSAQAASGRDPTQGWTTPGGLMSTIYDGLIVCGPGGRIIEVNERAAVLFQRPTDQLLQLAVTDIVDGADARLVADLEAMAGRQPFAVLDAYGLRGNGSGFAAEIVVHPVLADNAPRLVLFVRDIGRRLQMEKELVRLSKAVASTSDGVAITDEDGTHIYQNAAFLQLLGASQAADLATRRGFAWLLGAEAEPMQQTVAGGQSWSGRADIRGSNGAPVPTLFRVDPIRHEDGRIIGNVATVTDITKELETEEKLRRTLAELERSNAELEQIAYVASHDLKEPLRVIAGYLELLERRYEGQLDEAARSYIRHAVDGAERMRTLINHILDYARLNRAPGPQVTVNASLLVRQAHENLRSLIEERHALVTLDPLPDIRTTPARMVQVFQNLIDNAVRYCSADVPRVSVRAVRRGPDWVFLVTDNGIGIPAELRDRVFILFQRLHTQEESQGSGIGLSTCRKIVEGFGGRMWIEESSPGRGTTFAFSVPVPSLNIDPPAAPEASR